MKENERAFSVVDKLKLFIISSVSFFVRNATQKLWKRLIRKNYVLG